MFAQKTQQLNELLRSFGEDESRKLSVVDDGESLYWNPVYGVDIVILEDSHLNLHLFLELQISLLIMRKCECHLPKLISFLFSGLKAFTHLDLLETA